MFEKYKLMKAMNQIVCSLNNESGYYGDWINIVPDEATDNDLYFIAGDEELFTDAVKCFKGIMHDYLDDGLYICDKLY